MSEENYHKRAEELDKNDPLRKFRSEFVHPDEGLIYLDGNSLGRLPKKTVADINNTVNFQWGKRLIRSWNEGWYLKNREIGRKIAGLIGAKDNEVIIADSTSVNLYKLAFAAIKYKENRSRIVSDNMNFPSDLYILDGIIKNSFPDYELHLANSTDSISMRSSDFKKTIDKNTSLVSLSHVSFKSSYLYDMEKINSIIHDAGALDLWDLSHSAGAVQIDLNRCNSSLAVGCTYKYLNGGPGAPAFLYIREDLQEKLLPPLTGWFGDRDPFSFDINYKPSPGIGRFLTGTPPVLSLSCIENGVDILLEAGMERVRKKSIFQSEFLIEMIKKELIPLGFCIGSPEKTEERGSHLSIRHNNAEMICRAMIDDKIGDYVIIPDFRQPDNIRLGITPLYTSFKDLYICVREIKKIVLENLYKNISPDHGHIT